jgi:outer membrane immunogenic protein
MNKLLLTGVAFTALIAGPAIAADARAPVNRRPPVESWTGFYVGINAGGTWSENGSVNTVSFPRSDFLPGPASFATNSALGATGSVPVRNGAGFIGGQVGYNWQFGTSSPDLGGGVFVAGIEADIQGVTRGNNGGFVGNGVGPFPFFTNAEIISTAITSSTRLTYLGTLRGRLGYLVTPGLLLYGTGGLAYGRAEASTAISQTNNDCVFAPGACVQTTSATAGTFSGTRVGWTVGAGAEWMLWDNWSAKVEYLHYDLGSVTFGAGALVFTNGSFPGAGGPSVIASQSTTRFNGEIIRVGLNYKFGYTSTK